MTRSCEGRCRLGRGVPRRALRAEGHREGSIMRSIIRAMCLVGLAATVAACDLVGPHACTMEARPGILLTVQDSLTGVPVSGPLLAIAREGAYADTSRYDYPIVALAYERAGHYDVTVSATGYRLWTRSGVEVKDDGCHVETAHVMAWLQRQ